MIIATAKAQGVPNERIIDTIDRRVQRYLEKVGPRGAGSRDSTAIGIACWLVNDFGLSDATALAYLREWNARNVPPLSDSEIQAKIRNAHKSASRPAGCAHVRQAGRGGSVA